MTIESTYRLQFHAGFTFREATAIVPYLSALGITHVYASPYLKARPGSTHGYDVIDHSKLNPELGTPADFDAFLAALEQHGMSHILDIVPNHVGVATNDNAWWNDVLEHGRSSRYADYFDITWENAEYIPLYFVAGQLDGRTISENAKIWNKYLRLGRYDVTLAEYNSSSTHP